MALLEDLNKCSEKEVDDLILKAISNQDANSIKVEILGYTNDSNKVMVHKGFIPLNARIKFCNWSLSDYSMKSTDYFYEFAKYVKNLKLEHKGEIIFEPLQKYINSYFGLLTEPGDFRDSYFESLVFNTTKTDKEYFEKLESLQIGDLKGKNIAMCTERAALAQNLMSLFGHESYYCMGCVNRDGKDEPHCFNIVKGNGHYGLFDYSLPVCYKGKDDITYDPYIGDITLEEIDDFINNGMQKSFVIKGKERVYIVGETETKKVSNQKI